MQTPDPLRPVSRPRRVVHLPEVPRRPDQAKDEKRMLELVEELHGVTGRLGLPPQSLRIDPRALNGSEKAEEGMDVIARVDAVLGDLDASGLVDPLRLSEAVAPANPDAFLVSGFIRPGTTVMMTGPPGSSKSWAARQLALAVGTHRGTYLEQYRIDRPLRVLVVDEDNGPDEEFRREEALLTYFERTRADLGTVWRTSLAGVQLDQAPWQSWLRGVIRLLELDLVILDPISEMHGGKELREDPAFRSMLGFLKRLKVEFPHLATLLVHHTRKPATSDRTGPRTLDDVRGQWGQTPDVVALMWPIPGERRVSWELHKRVPHSRLVLAATEAGPLEVASDPEAEREERVRSDDKVLGAIDGGAGTVEEIAEAANVHSATAYRAIARLVGLGLITKHPPHARLIDRTDDPLTDSTGAG